MRKIITRMLHSREGGGGSSAGEVKEKGNKVQKERGLG